MPNVSIWSAFEFVGNDGGRIGTGAPDEPTILNGVDGQRYVNGTDSLAQNSSATLWTTALGPTRFNFACLLSDVGDDTNGLVMVEFTTDLDNSVGTSCYTMALKAGIPLTLSSDRSYANYTSGFATGTLDYIQSIKVKNLNTTAANVTLWLVF